MTKPDTSNITKENYIETMLKLDLWIDYMVKEINEEHIKNNDLQQHVGSWYFEYGEIEEIFYRPSPIFSCDRFKPSFWSEITKELIREIHMDDACVILIVNNGKERRQINIRYDYENKNVTGQIGFSWPVA